MPGLSKRFSLTIHNVRIVSTSRASARKTWNSDMKPASRQSQIETRGAAPQNLRPEYARALAFNPEGGQEGFAQVRLV